MRRRIAIWSARLRADHGSRQPVAWTALGAATTATDAGMAVAWRLGDKNASGCARTREPEFLHGKNAGSGGSAFQNRFTGRP